MKDTHVMEVCISPTSIPAESPYFKKSTVRLFEHLSFRRYSMQSCRDHPTTKDQEVIRIADAPSDTQGATEPDRVATPRGNNGDNDSDFSGKMSNCPGGENNMMFVAPKIQPPQAGNDITEYDMLESTRTTADSDTCSEVVREDSTKGIPRQHMSIKSWRHCVPAELSRRRGLGESLSKNMETHSKQLQTSPTSTAHEHKPSEIRKPLQYSVPHYQIHPLSTYSSPCERPWKTSGEPTQHLRKPSNLSAIERQRGPIKKRHINYQPDVLDLSVKRTKPEPDNVGSSYGCSNVRSWQSVRAASPDGNRLNTALKQEQKFVTENKIHVTGSFREGMKDPMGREHHEGVTNQEIMEPLASLSRGFHLSEQTPFNISDIYKAGNGVVPQFLHNSELVRQWVLHVTQNNEMHTIKQLQAQLAADLESNHSSAASDVSQGSMSSLPTFNNNLGRGPRLMSNTASLPEKPYACEHCSSTFKHRHHVIRHMRAHNGERPFHCQDCGAAFARKCVLTNHRRTHTGEKPYICSECGDTFSRKHHLVIHQRTHSGEKPYRCLECGAAFARSHHVNRHRKTHEKALEDGTSGLGYDKSLNSSEKINQLPSIVPLMGKPSVLTGAGTELTITNPGDTQLSQTSENEATAELLKTLP